MAKCILIIVLLYNGGAVAQKMDTFLLKNIIHTIATHAKMTSTTLSVTEGDLMKGIKYTTTYFYWGNSLKDSNSTRPLICIIRPKDWKKPLQQLGSDERGFLMQKQNDLYAVDYFIHKATRPPVILSVDTVVYSENKCILKMNTHHFHTFTNTGWKLLPLKKPPKFYYKFVLEFTKKENKWQLSKLKRCKNGKFGIAHKKHIKYGY